MAKAKARPRKKPPAALDVLFVASEAHPLIKTGGLADVAGSLPIALTQLGQRLHLLLPAYAGVKRQSGALLERARFTLAHGRCGEVEVRLLEGRLADSEVILWLVDVPEYFAREGGPYQDAAGQDWPDNAERFALFCRVAALLAIDQLGLGWRPDIVHLNDWQSALTALFLQPFPFRPRLLFTIHNLAYQGLFSRAQFNLLDLPESAWSIEGVEYYGQLSFIKAGINCSDWISTVSPTYAREITTFAYGCGLDGLLRARQSVLVGILNGIDAQVWNPATDPLIPHHYNADDLSGKRLDKVALLRRMGLPADDELPLLAMVTRLVEQKGIDLLLEILPWLMTQPLRLVVLGNGDPHYTELLLGCARRHPDRLAVVAGYDEPLAHQIEAGADLFVMPSRFEPCGLNQLYSLCYGTLPLVRRVGGLADTVIDADAATEGNGFCFDFASGPALRATLERALALYHQPARWQQLMRSAMAADFSWQRSSADYLALYRRMLAPQ